MPDFDSDDDVDHVSDVSGDEAAELLPMLKLPVFPDVSESDDEENMEIFGCVLFSQSTPWFLCTCLRFFIL